MEEDQKRSCRAERGSSLFRSYEFLYLLLVKKTPITIPQMLWINIIMDTLGSLAFAGEAPRASFMKRAPRRREEPILSRDTVKTIVSRGLYSLSFFIWFLTSDFVRERFGDRDGYFLTAFFALFVFLSRSRLPLLCFYKLSFLAHIFYFQILLKKFFLKYSFPTLKSSFLFKSPGDLCVALIESTYISAPFK